MSYLDDYAEICPEAVFIPKYPQFFEIDLIIDKKNYGKIKLEIREELDIYSFKGVDNALKKFEEIAQSHKNKLFRYPLFPYTEVPLSYPIKDAISFLNVLQFEEKFKKGEGFYSLADFICKVLNPLNTTILYEKTGIFISD